MKAFLTFTMVALLAAFAGCRQPTSTTVSKPPIPGQNNVGVNPSAEESEPAGSTENNDAADGKPKEYVVYDFWAEWCGPCKAFGPTFEAWKAKYSKPNVTFTKVNVDEDRAMAKKYNISAIPTLIVTVNGKEKKRFTGAPSEQQVASLLK